MAPRDRNPHLEIGARASWELRTSIGRFNILGSCAPATSQPRGSALISESDTNQTPHVRSPKEGRKMIGENVDDEQHVGDFRLVEAATQCATFGKHQFRNLEAKPDQHCRLLSSKEGGTQQCSFPQRSNTSHPLSIQRMTHRCMSFNQPDERTTRKVRALRKTLCTRIPKKNLLSHLS